MADAPLSTAETRDLGDVAGTMIPADAALGVPGADDPAILDDIVKSIGRDLPLVREALAAIAQKAGGAIDMIIRGKREIEINVYYKAGGPEALALGRVSLGADYRDDRVRL